MSLAYAAIRDAALSHAAASGYFDQVTGHEPKNAPGKGLSASAWVQNLRPVPLRSGLAATSVRVELSVRLMVSMLREPQDQIDVDLLTAADALMRAWTADFDLDGTGQIDVLGAYGTPLQGEAGYLNQDGTLYRAFVIALPVIVNDLWPQEA